MNSTTTVKSYVLLLLISLCFIGCFKKKKETDLSKDGILKPAVSVTNNYYDVDNSFGNLTKIPVHGSLDYPVVQCSYDDNGNLLDKNYYNATGALVRKETFDRDNAGLLITWKDEWSWMQAQELAGENFHTVISKTYAYDIRGKIIKEITENENGDPLGVIKESINYEYDSLLNSVKEYIEREYKQQENNTLSVQSEATDSDALAIEAAINQIKNSHRTPEKFSRETFYSNDNKDLKFIVYDSLGNITSIDTSIYQDVYSEFKTTFGFGTGSGTFRKYDKYGNVVENGDISTEGTRIPYGYMTYEYDQYGSWVKEINYDKDRIPQKIIERTITYK